MHFVNQRGISMKRIISVAAFAAVTFFIASCDGGSDGKTPVTRITAEASGDHCQFGGNKVETGFDDNDNGELDKAEAVTKTMYLCNGAEGTDGNKGDKGEKGDTGAQGPQGDKGDAGAQGEKGDKGDKGDAGTPGEKGDKGDKGDAGTPGEKGDKGDKGDAGTPGEKRRQGRQG